MIRWLSRPNAKIDPWWDLEGPVAKQERQRTRLRRAQAAIAWLDLAAIAALAVVGPHAFRLAFLH